MRHIGRQKCREPAITEQVGCFLINWEGHRKDGKTPDVRRGPGTKARRFFSMYGRSLSAVNVKQWFFQYSALSHKLYASPSNLRRLANLRGSFTLTRPLRRHSLYP
jgi:hypothetical protein